MYLICVHLSRVTEAREEGLWSLSVFLPERLGSRSGSDQRVRVLMGVYARV